MIIVDLTEAPQEEEWEWEPWNYSYESEICPRVGETVSCLNSGMRFTAKILEVDHLIGTTVGSGGLTQKLVTCVVEVFGPGEN